MLFSRQEVGFAATGYFAAAMRLDEQLQTDFYRAALFVRKMQ
jgi:hypothetical protein